MIFAPNSFIWQGMRFQVTPLAVHLVQVKRHKKNKRINKKWLKRYGRREEPCAYKMQDPFSGQDVLVIHPELFNKLKDELV